MEKELKNKKVVYSIIAIITLLIAVIGATYAYFTIQSSNEDIKSNKVDGTAGEITKPTLTTNIEELKINLDSKLMDQTKAGTTYYATESGTPVTTATLGSGKYTLATASVASGNVVYDCNYTYNVSGTVTKAITDGSDENVKITFTSPSGEEKTYTLKQVLSGIEYEGILTKLKVGTNQTIEVSAYVENTSSPQDDLVGNVFTFKIEMTSGEEGFSCDEYTPYNVAKESKGQAAATFMATNQAKIEGLWNSGLEGDGLRYVGTGPNLCSYNDGEYQTTNITSCPTLYNYIRTTISSGATTNYTYQTSCPSDTSTYTYSCTTLPGTLLPAIEPANYICFGTTSSAECKANEDKYMYRIIGIFPDENGTQHLKLRKFKQLGTKKWNDTRADVNWGESTLYTELNGSYFLGNTTYSYLQDDSWSNKIENWKWTAVNTKTYDGSNGPNYYNDSTMTPANIYLHEMNRSAKTSTVGEWTYPTGKIGLIYASDYVLSLGDEALAITGSTSSNYEKLKTGWLHPSNNDTSKSTSEWYIARRGANHGELYAWHVDYSGYVYGKFVTNTYGVAPVFYLTSDVTLSSGTGAYTDPYIIG